MRIRVLLFGQLKDIVGKPEETLDLDPGTSLSALVAHYSHRYAQFQPLAGSIACALNQEYAPASALRKGGDEVALLPPGSGGVTTQPLLQSPHCCALEEKIASETIPANMNAREGAGTVIRPASVR